MIAKDLVPFSGIKLFAIMKTAGIGSVAGNPSSLCERI